MRALLVVFSAAVLLVLFAPVAVASGPETATNQTEANKAVVRRAFQALEQGDLKTLNEIFDPKGPIHTPKGKTILQGGPFTNVKDSCGMCAALNPRKITIDLILGDGDFVAVRSTWSGNYTGTVRGTPITGKDVTVVYTNFYRVSNGRIVENWFESNSLDLAEQVGMKLVPESQAK
jgi:ketosteroid isomerase-like protein